VNTAVTLSQDLWRIRAPCAACEGFDVSAMDQMVQVSLMEQLPRCIMGDKCLKQEMDASFISLCVFQ